MRPFYDFLKNTVAKHKRLTHEHIIHLVRLLRAISGGASEIVGRHRISQRLNLQCDSFTITFPLCCEILRNSILGSLVSQKSHKLYDFENKVIKIWIFERGNPHFLSVQMSYP